jgi:hypothetical protein
MGAMKNNQTYSQKSNYKQTNRLHIKINTRQKETDLLYASSSFTKKYCKYNYFHRRTKADINTLKTLNK